MSGQAKKRHTQNILEYLSDPQNEIPSREELALNVCGFARRQSLNKTFPGTELQDIEKLALDIRRTKYASSLAKVDKALLEVAEKGDPRAAKLCYQRFESWGEKVNVSGALVVTHTLSPEAEEVLANVYDKAGSE